MFLKILFPIVFFVLTGKVETKSNNACHSLLSYYAPNLSKDCYFNPDVGKNNTELLDSHFGANFETHTTRTEDGYDLTLFRIKNPKSKDIIILYHPITVDSFVWIGQSNESLAVKLFELGYEVWLPNTRGTLYSQGHANLSLDDPEYWNFSFHEVGLYDVDAITKFVQKTTNRSDLIGIGQSFGTSSFLAYSSLRPKESKSAYKLLIHLALIGYLNHVPIHLRIVARFTNIFEELGNLFNIHDLLRSNSISSKTLRFLGLHSATVKIIANFLEKISAGWSKGGFDKQFYNLLFSNYPRAISVKIIAHYGQICKSGKFQMYDYGKDRNKEIYGQDYPLEYPLGEISTPMYVVYSDTDLLATTKDSKHLMSKLRKEVLVGEHQAFDINHVEYFYGKRRFELVYNKIFDILNNYQK